MFAVNAPTIITITVDVEELPSAIAESIVAVLSNRGIILSTANGPLGLDDRRAIVRELSKNAAQQVLFADRSDEVTA